MMQTATVDDVRVTYSRIQDISVLVYFCCALFQDFDMIVDMYNCELTQCPLSGMCLSDCKSTVGKEA